MNVISIELQGLENIDRLANKLGDLSVPMREFQAYRRETFTNQIAAEVSPTGGEIAPLSERYRLEKSRTHPGRPKRVRTGRTVDSYRSRIIGNTLVEELSSPYVIHMQRGTDKMPARPYFPESLTPQDQKAWEAIINRLVLRSWL